MKSLQMRARKPNSTLPIPIIRVNRGPCTQVHAPCTGPTNPPGREERMEGRREGEREDGDAWWGRRDKMEKVMEWVERRGGRWRMQ